MRNSFLLLDTPPLAAEEGGRHKPLAVRSKLKVINRRIYEARVAGNTCRIVKALNKVDAPI